MLLYICLNPLNVHHKSELLGKLRILVIIMCQCRFTLIFLVFKRFYLLLRRREGSERNIYMWDHIDWLPLTQPQLQLGAWPTTQAGALTGNQTHKLSLHRQVLNSLSHASQGHLFFKYYSGERCWQWKWLCTCENTGYVGNACTFNWIVL